MKKSTTTIDSGKGNRPISHSKAPTPTAPEMEDMEHQTSAKDHKAEALENNNSSGPSFLLILFGLALFAAFVLIATFCTLRQNPHTAE
jgi:hypothetical protein